MLFMDRRSALKSILGGVGAVAVAPGVVAEGLEQVVTVEEVKPTFEDFMAGRVNGGQYLDKLAEGVPMYEELHKRGVVKGILYNPNQETAVKALEDVFSNRLNGKTAPPNIAKEIVGYAVSREMEKARGLMRDDCVGGFAFPSPNNPKGDHWARYIVMKHASAFEYVRCDEDLKSVIFHEAVHSADAAYGDKIFSIDYGVEPEISSYEFLNAFFEVKAMYLQIVEAMKKTPGEEGAVSHDFFGNLIESYFDFTKQLHENAQTEYEKRIVDTFMMTPKEFKMYDLTDQNQINIVHNNGKAYTIELIK